jgi:hypothetical protein
MPVDLPTGREDFDLAASAYRKAAERGFAPAMNNLGSTHVSGLFGSAQRSDGALWILRAARAGNPFGAVNATLLYFYWSGNGVRPDSAEARRWSEWTGEDVNPKDLAYPTLEHTSMVLRSGLEPRLFWTIREAAKRRIPLGASFTPLRPDPRLPAFSPVIRYLRIDASHPRPFCCLKSFPENVMMSPTPAERGGVRECVWHVQSY